MSAAALAEALEAATAALAGGDPIAAAAALGRAEAATAGLSAAGIRLSPEELVRARALHAACLEAARREAERLGGALGQAGSARRAHDAYGR